MAILRDSGAKETPVASAARITSGTVDAGVHYGSCDSLRAQLSVTAASGTSPTLNVVIEDTLDGTTWYIVGTFAQKAAVGTEVINVTIPFSDRLRVRWTIAGTTPSFTFAVDWYIQ